ncbi:MAG: aldo/keto reductase [Acidobacteriota bacterium]|nr:aldo/keto reductase [Acidobacteriota bacterium]
MDYRKLGPTGIEVSSLCLGTMMFGAWGNTDHDDCARIIHRALETGINFIDTANMYSDGECEEIIGKALSGRRDRAILATKVYFPMGDGPDDRGLSRVAIVKQVEASLRRLGTDYIDLYQIHRPDPTVSWEETLGALDDLVRQGKVRQIGCSTNHHDVGDVPRLTAWQIVQTFRLSDANGWNRFVSLQPPYSILRRTMEREHFPMTLDLGMANIVWSPLEGGWLAGNYRYGSEPADQNSPRYKRWIKDTHDPKFERRSKVVEGLAEYLEHREGRPVGMAEFSLAWVLSNPAVTSAIIGPRTMEQLENCFGALNVEITEADRARVDELVPPGETAL